MNPFRLFALTLLCIGLVFSHRVWAAIPKAPTTLTAVATTSGQINLAWLDVSTDETGFEVEQSTDGTKFVRVADLPANAIVYQDKSLKPATKYWYRVRSKNASGNSAYSNIANATTLPVTIPKAPSALAATVVSATQLNLTWTDNATDETGFELERSTNALSFTKIADLPANTTTYQNTGLAPATRYWFRVVAKNTAGKSAYSNIANATTLQVAPNAPANLTATDVSTSQINLKWTDNANNETGFQIERSADGAVFTKIVDVAANVTTYQNTGLSAATQYHYRVRAVNAVGASAYSNTASARTQNVPVPNAPVNLTAVPTAPGLIQLRWEKPTGNATDVVLERAKGDGDFVQLVKLPATVLQYEDKSEFESDNYYYRIKAVNAGGDSPYSLVAIVRAASVITSVEPVSGKHLVYAAGRTLVVELGLPAQAQLTVYDQSGRLYKSQKIGRSARVDLAMLPVGIYIVVAEIGQDVLSRRIVLY